MKKIDSIISNYIKEMHGKVIGIGLNEKHALEIEKNEQIINCDLLDYNINSHSLENGKTKKLYFNQIRKKYKKKKVDYIIGDIDKIDVCKKTFIRDSIYINKEKIIYYIKDASKLNLYINRYKRYNVDIKVIDCKDGKIIEITTTNSKNHKFIDKLYYIKDTLYDLVDIVGDLLSS